MHSLHDHHAWTTQLREDPTARDVFNSLDTNSDGRLIPPPAVKHKASCNADVEHAATAIEHTPACSVPDASSLHARTLPRSELHRKAGRAP